MRELRKHAAALVRDLQYLAVLRSCSKLLGCTPAITLDEQYFHTATGVLLNCKIFIDFAPQPPLAGHLTLGDLRNKPLWQSSSSSPPFSLAPLHN